MSPIDSPRKRAYNGAMDNNLALDQELSAFAEKDHAPSTQVARERLKVRYTHRDMIDFIIANPSVSQDSLAIRYGYSAGWVSIMINSDAFQVQMAARRAEIVNPELIATVEERFRALTARSLQRLMGELDKPACKPEVMLRAAELGAKAMGIGGNAPPPAPPPSDHLEQLARRLVALNRQEGSINGTAERIEVSGPEREDSPELRGQAVGQN